MKSSEEKSLRYVLRHYKPGTFDTRRAIRKFELRRQGHTLHRTLLMWVLGVAAIVLFVYGLYGWFSTAEKVEPWTQLTAANHTETYVLPDSSRVTLYPESTLRYQKGKFGRRERSVLVSGKAYFRVSPDPACPFRVTGRYGTVRVLGTAFEFDEMSREGETVVYVTEGRVAFAVKETFGGIFLYPGMAASLKDGAGMPEEMHPDVPNPAAWATGTFVYENTPLEEVLRELSAYYGVRLSSEDTGKMLTAEFDTDEGVDGIVALIEQSLGTHINKE